MDSNKAKDNWHDLLVYSLKSGTNQEKTTALDFLSQQSSLSLKVCKELFPLIKENILHPDTETRYFARKARNHVLDCFPEVEPGQPPLKTMPLQIKEGETLSAEQILLHKLRLGSRYVVFEALERLTESGDRAIIGPLLDYLEEEKDEHKISYLLKVLGRIHDERIPETLVDYLNHEDPRIVANALESLCRFEVPYTVDRLIEFATSQDNRIRANAILGLFKYDQPLAEKHISEMMHSTNIALQASGVYLLKVLRPSNLSELLQVAHQSRFASVRIKALDIPPPDTDELEINELKKNEDLETPNPRRDMFLMEVFVLIGAFVLVVSESSSQLMLAIAFLFIAILILAMHEKTRTSVQKMALSMGFVSSLALGNTRLMVLPALMGLWLTWNGNIINKQGKLERARLDSMFAWFFTLGSIIITQLIQNEMSNVLNLAAKLAEAGTNIPEPIADIVTRQQRFELMIFVLVSLMAIFIMKFNQWFPAKTPEQKPLKRLVVATVVCMGIVLLVNVSHVFGINLQIKVHSLGNVLEILKNLLP